MSKQNEVDIKDFQDTSGVCPIWYPHHPPIYDINKTYKENIEAGHSFTGEIYARRAPQEKEWKSFLEYKVASPIGVPAGPLLSSNWIGLAASLGFDILTYKTIRSHAFPAHSLPNMVYVVPDTIPYPEGFKRKDSLPIAQQIDMPHRNLSDLSVSNSFGNPSMSPAFLLEDIARANQLLSPGQVMVVSVFGSLASGKDPLQDFVDTAELAKEGGAQIIEANFSCPNVELKEGAIYLDPNLVFKFAREIARAIHPLPLIIKVGLFETASQMQKVMIMAAKAGVRGFSGINTVSMNIFNNKGGPALGENRLRSGVCGGVIRRAAIEFIKKASHINKREKLDLTIIGVGGITLPEHFDLFLDVGASVAMTATGMMWDPYLATRYHIMKGRRKII